MLEFAIFHRPVAHYLRLLTLQGLVVFDIDKEKWTLDLRPGKGSVVKGGPAEGDKPDLTLTITDDNFVKLASGKLGPQQVLLVLLCPFQSAILCICNCSIAEYKVRSDTALTYRYCVALAAAAKCQAVWQLRFA